ncbi:hypothetical protein D1007_59478 [Hordeum vulgare]|nr:hypothetical protein D1007_59478 [Hordeum vulgare]
MAIFCHLDTFELTKVSKLLDLFGVVSGLRTNFTKYSVVPIQCPPSTVDAVDAALNYSVASFLVSYLGLPFSLSKVPPSHLMPLVDKLVSKLAT